MSDECTAATVPLTEVAAERLRQRSAFAIEPQEIGLLGIDSDGSIDLLIRLGSADPDWLDLPANSCRFVEYLDLDTGKLGIALWMPHGAADGASAQAAMPTLAPFVDGGDIPVTTDSYDLNDVLQAMQRWGLARNPAGFRMTPDSTELADLLEFQPAEIDDIIRDRRHRRFANLFWFDQGNGTLSLNKCANGSEYAAGGTVTTTSGWYGNPAPLAVADSVDVSGMLMHAAGGGFVLPDPDVQATWDFIVDWQAPAEPVIIPPAPQQRTWEDRRTEHSERNYHKVNACGRLTINRPSADASTWSVSIVIGADAFQWDGASIFGSWGRNSHHFRAGAMIYAKDDWNRRWATSVTPVTSAGTDGNSGGGIGVTCNLPAGLFAGSGLYVCSWWYHRDAPNTGPYFQQDDVTVNGDITFTTDPG